ncbi:MAG TPA: hypothetical protein VFA68_02640 [Terriglobales bacterium]|nr:hypothetical protein [Terriglobales bacterium]
MFDTLEPSEQLIARRWPLLMYGTYAVGGLVFVVLGLRRHGFSQPFRLALGTAMFSLSITWFTTTLRSTSPWTNRKFGVRNMILILLLMAHEFADL